MAARKTFQGLPQWAQGVISVAVVGGLGFIGYKIYSAVKQAKELESATAENKESNLEAQKLIKKGVKPSLNPTQLASTVNGIKLAFSDYDAIMRSHVQPFYREMVKVNNDLDMLNLIRAYGNQTIDFPFTKFTVSDFTGNLTQSAKNFLNNKEIAAANNSLARRGIKYRF
jgi:hypothetical protein